MEDGFWIGLILFFVGALLFIGMIVFDMVL